MDRPLQKISHNNKSNKTAEPIGNVSNGTGITWEIVQPEAEQPHEAFLWLDERLKAAAADVPSAIKQLLEAIYCNPWTITRNKAFYAQARLMARYEDHADIVPFSAYYPVYRDMTVPQLRSYFTIRTMLRRGSCPDAPLSYLFVYIYETLMQIGVDNAQEGLEILEEVRQAYAKSEPKLDKYLSAWLKDYVVYYRLNDQTTKYFHDEQQEDARVTLLNNYATAPDGLLFELMTSLSRYKLTAAALYKHEPDTVKAAAVRVLRAVTPMLEARHHRSIEQLCVGEMKSEYYPMFASAVFYSPTPVREAVFCVSNRRKYTCNGGIWTRDTLRQDTPTARGVMLGDILHETDRQLRIALHRGPKMTQRMHDTQLSQLIRQAIADYLRERELSKRPKVNVDISQLGRIRADADVVRDALLTEEDVALQPSPMEEKHTEKFADGPSPTNPQAPTSPPVSAKEAEKGPFSSQESAFLRLLIAGDDWRSYLQNIHMPLGVMTSAINEKAIDLLGDIVIDDTDGLPMLLEDYRENISNMI